MMMMMMSEMIMSVMTWCLRSNSIHYSELQRMLLLLHVYLIAVSCSVIYYFHSVLLVTSDGAFATDCSCFYLLMGKC